jgi:anti-sigma-K factor RskA
LIRVAEGNMTVHNDNSIPDDDQQQLVSYLDGEIGGEEALAVEERLARDPRFRRSLNELQRSWEMLDDLPQSVASEQFTKTTVEMVAVQIDNDVGHQQRRWGRARAWQRTATAGSILLIFVAGFFVAKYLLEAPDRAFLQDLPIIERVEVYEHIDDLEFLQKLADEGLFNEDLSEEATP